MTTITTNEKTLLVSMLDNDFQDGGDGTSWLWSDCIDNGPLTGLVLAGTAASLCKKGLAETDGLRGRDACIRLTHEGVALAKA